MAEQKDEEEEYDGPYIDKRIEWKCPDRKRHNVVLFGSWNRFKGGDELDYQGKQVFACNVKLPLGTYVYRFLIDAEEWETHNNAPKTARNGIEYNQIRVTEDSDDEAEDDFAQNEGDEEPGAEEEQNTMVQMGPDGQMIIGKKRKGRPSVELDLGQDFAAEEDDEDDEGDDGDDGQEEGDEDDGDTTSMASSETSVATSSAPHSTPGGGGADRGGQKRKQRPKKKKNRRKGRRKKQGKSGKDDKEWAKYVFVQQLRLQQQHNDEINRVKTLWKQERQVRVEMHKKVVKQLREKKKEVEQQAVEIDRLKKRGQIGASSDEKLSSEFKEQITELQREKEQLQGDLKKKEKEFTEYKKQRVEEDKQNRQSKGDWEQRERKYKHEISALKSKVEFEQSQRQSLESNLTTLKDGNAKTLELKALQYSEREDQWNQEKEQYESVRKEHKAMKAANKKLESELEESRTETAAERKKVAAGKSAVEDANEKIKSLEGMIEDLKNSNEAAERVQIEVNKVKAEKENEVALLNEKLNNTEKMLEQQKQLHDEKMKEMQANSQAELAALKNQGDAQMNEVMEKLKADIAAKNESLSQKQEEIAQLQSGLSEEKVNNDGLTNKIESLEQECSSVTAAKEAVTKELDELRAENSKQSEELKSLQSSSSAANEENAGKIEKLENEVSSLKANHEEESKEHEERVLNLEAQAAELKESINSKNEEAAQLTSNLTDARQEIEKYKSSETALGSEVSSLKEQLTSTQDTMSAKEQEYQDSMDKLQSEMNGQIEARDGKIQNLTEDLNKKAAELTAKLEEFSNAETRIAELNVDLEAERQNLENAEKNHNAAIAVHVAKENRVHNSCKSLFTKFTGIREEMKSIQEEQISQLEEVSKFFGDFSPLLAKVFGFNQTLVDDLLTKYKRELSLRRKYFNMVQDLRGNIRVFCRFRPLLPFELKKGYTECVKFPQEGAVKIVDDKGKTLPFEFDQVYTPKTTQEQVTEDATEYIQSVMDGYNVSIFAYGQTGSGKTYTMNGPKDNPGVNLRALKHLFKITEERAPQFQYKIKVSIFEIYNEKINDLIVNAEDVLHGGKKKKKKRGKDDKKKSDGFKIRHLPDGSVEVQGLTKITVQSDDDINTLNRIAAKNRSAATTDMNAHSSRSHMLLVVDVAGINIPANIKYFGKLYLVDLAGSERVKKSGAVGQALKEAQNINKSLSALGDVMQALQRKEKFIPYRNSTLTDLMANALGGNAKTIMFINCCPASEHAFETVSSLKFAKRVGKVELGQAKKHTSKH